VIAELTRKVDALEAEVEELNRTVQALQDESAFLHRLLADPSARSTLPPPPSS
jgi:cell division protein FtsB